MELTGMKFDLNPETFTLQNMFAMELHRFSDVIADITGSATKELSIEKGIDYYISTSISMFTTISKKRNQNVDA
jgi:dynein heavy chain